MIDSTPRPSTGLRLTPQLVFGLIVIAAGVLFTLDNLGFLYAENYTRFWPTGLIAIGLLKLSQTRRGPPGLVSLLMVVLGAWLLFGELTEHRIRFGDVWPLLLVGFGGYLVWQGLSVRTSARPSEGGSMISAMAILGGVSRGSNTRNFRSADLTAILGGCELDLRNATLDEDAVIDIFCLWGGIEIRVPEEWTIESQIVPILGGVDEKTRRPGAAGPRVTVRGLAIMSGVEIKN